eukprot:jgi/Chlat1/3886/Chrsp26S04165
MVAGVASPLLGETPKANANGSSPPPPSSSSSSSTRTTITLAGMDVDLSTTSGAESSPVDARSGPATLPDAHAFTPSGLTRARRLGVPFEGTPGELNAITDVGGVEVGYVTLIEGSGPLIVGEGPVRTGVTALLPRGRERSASAPCFAGWLLSGPVTLTNTHSCGVARDASVRWMVKRAPMDDAWGLPVAGETYDGYLNDINGFHVKEQHVLQAIDRARGGSIDEGSVGGGTGMMCFEYKGGSGTASRVVTIGSERYTVGAFVQANFGLRQLLTVAGVPVGKHLTENCVMGKREEAGSVIGIIATDAPLIPHQLKRLARRAGLGIGRSGSIAAHGSGDIFLAFSTGNEAAISDQLVARTELTYIADKHLNPIFEAAIQATDEAVINSMIANETMVGRDGHTVHAIPHDKLMSCLHRYNR